MQRNGSYIEEYALSMEGHFISAVPAYWTNFAQHLSLAAKPYYKYYQLKSSLYYGYTPLSTASTHQRFQLDFALDQLALVDELEFTGPLGILSDVGGLFNSLKLILVVALSGRVYRLYKESIVKYIRESNETYSDTKKEDLVELLKQRLSAV